MRLLLACFVLLIMFYTIYTKSDLELHRKLVRKMYKDRESWKTSILGGILYKQHPVPGSKQYIILFWNYKQSLHRRHNFYFGLKQRDSLKDCSVKNCVFTKNNSLLRTADAVVVDLYYSVNPPMANRNPEQRWIFLFDESPKTAFGSGFTSRKDYRYLGNVFNWSMTYATESDVPAPYGRMVPLPNARFAWDSITLENLVPFWKNKQHETLVAILSVHCIPYQKALVTRLRNYINVDDYGRCGERKFKDSCSGRHTDCKQLSKYLFFLAFENSKCKEFMTDTLFYNAFYRGSIPIIQGPSLIDCDRLLPPHSYLHVDNYRTMEDLAEDIINIANDKKKHLEYHLWRNHFEIVNEHGYFGTTPVHQCRICEAMNYNDPQKSIYSSADLSRFLNEKSLCTSF